MKGSSVKTFLHVSNALISVLCVFAVLAFLVFPVFSVNIRIRPTAEAVRAVTDGKLGDSPLVNSLISSLDENGMKADLSLSVSTLSILRGMFVPGAVQMVDRIDEAVDQLVSNAKGLLEDTLPKAAESAAREVIKSGIASIAGQAGIEGVTPELAGSDPSEAYDRVMDELGPESRKRTEGLIDRIIKAVTDDGATIKSVTDVVVSGLDEAADILSDSGKFTEEIPAPDEEMKREVKEVLEEYLKPFSDGEGKLVLKDKLLEMILDSAAELVDGGSVSMKKTGTVILLGTGGAESRMNSAEKSEEILKSKLKSMFFKNVPTSVINTIHIVTIIAGILIIITFLLLLYPLIRTLTKIGSKNPGFILAAPVVGGIFPFIITVIVPTVAAAILGSGIAARLISGASGMDAADVTAILSSAKITFSSGSIFAFVLAIALLIFSFVYGHFRRKLKRIQNEE